MSDLGEENRRIPSRQKGKKPETGPGKRKYKKTDITPLKNGARLRDQWRRGGQR